MSNVTAAAIGFVVFIAAAIPAQAEDAHNKANWTGPYLGLEGGYGWGTARQSDTKWQFDSGNFSTSGGIVGGEAGYNWKVGRVLLGIEGDISWTGINGSTAGSGTCAGGSPKCEADLTALGTVRGRIGYPVGRFLPFLAGGLAVGDVYGKEGDTASSGGSGSKFRLGWTAGGGLERSIATHWTAKIEYLYVDLGKAETFRDNFSGETAMESIELHEHIVRGALSYKF